MLYLVATPIGNLGDASPRVAAALRAASVIACEDTRRTGLLLQHLGIPAPAKMISYREQTELRVGPELIRMLKEGLTVAMCSDGGYPGISDPGYRLASLAVENAIVFEVIPGPSAVDIALLQSGLPTSSFTFKGYPPRKPGPLLRFFEQERDLPHTLIVYESPMRVAVTLEAAANALGDRQAAVCIELTKKFERISRGFLRDLVQEFTGKTIKGEVTVVIAGNHPKFTRQTDVQEETH